MAIAEVEKILPLVSDIAELQPDNVWINYDKEADVMYINFKRPSNADNSEITDDDIIVRYENGEIIGITVMHASKRQRPVS